MWSPSIATHSCQLEVPTPRSKLKNKAVVIGLYGLPGSGKTFLLRELEKELGTECFLFFDGSDMIAAVTPGGLEAFHKLSEPEKVSSRQLAIDTIGQRCAESGQVAIVTGHLMFWPEQEDAGSMVYTQNDMSTFTHILYLNPSAECVAQRRLQDTRKSRPSASTIHLWKWQQAEKTQLRRICHQHGILFSLLSSPIDLPSKVSRLVRDFRQHTEDYNLSRAECRLDGILVTVKDRLRTMLVLDADRTLAAEDTGALFWEEVFNSWWPKIEESPLKTLFSSPLGYSYTAFRQAVLLYEETAEDKEFEALCSTVASKVTARPEFVSLLRRAAEEEHVGAVLITCGLRRVWEKVLDREGLSRIVKVIGGGRIADGFVVTAGVKAALVTRLQKSYGIYVWAFGDSPLDLKMLKNADQAIVVVGEEQTRSKTMDAALMTAVENNGLRAHQAVLHVGALPRLNFAQLPSVCLTDKEFVDSVLCHRFRHGRIEVYHATDRKATKLLMTQMRDANVAGPVLREAHRRVGWYLGTELLPDVVGLHEYMIPHVQGHSTTGHRLLRERETLIVALMRGGEAMAFGINDAFPLAMFMHAKNPSDLTLNHLDGAFNIVLVDSVLNSGKTVIEFVQHIRKLNATIRIVVVVGVIQAQSISSSGSLAEILGCYLNLHFVALRISDNKYTGKGTTDTGNRLFNTTHLA